MKTARSLSVTAAAGLALLSSGCWTVHRSVRPRVEFSRAPEGLDARVQLSGFEATVTSYVPVYGHETVWRSRPFHRRGRGWYGGVSAETYSTTTYYPRTDRTTAFVELARERLEDAGFLVGVTNAGFRIDVKFSGPVVTGGDRTAQAMWLLCSALSADYAAQTWSAGLRIYDVKTGRLLLHTDYDQKYSAAVWGPIPIFSPASADETSFNFIQSWCLSALTDRALADATAFIAERTK